jgi:deoxycytidine triphosphate deaminase
MLLNYEEIQSKGIIKNAKSANYGNGSYNVQVGKIISVAGKEHDTFCIKPQGMVIVISVESFEMPENIIGHATIKNSISNSGILAINIGIIDPGYKGQLSSVLLNFGKNDYDINIGQEFIRLTFQEFKKPSKSIDIPDLNTTPQKYIQRKKDDSRIYFDELFLSLNNLSAKIFKDIRNSIIKYGFAITIAVGIIACLFTTYFNYFNKNYKTNEDKFKVMQDQIDTYKQLFEDLKKQDLELKKQIDRTAFYFHDSTIKK